jgi:flagellar motor switch protein FliG
MSLSPSLRKAAVLISALDAEAADALLAQMSADDAAKIRRVLAALDDIPPDEQQQVLAEFLGEQGSSPSASSKIPENVTLELDPALEDAVGMDRQAPTPTSTQTAGNPASFAFLERVEPKAIATLLGRELPQTIAVVVAHLPPQQAAAVLQELPATLATDALERIAGIDEPSPEIQADLIRWLRRQLAPHLRTANADATSLAHLSAVLEAMDYRHRQRVVLQLGEQNHALVHRLGLAPTGQQPAAQRDGIIAMRYRLDSRTTNTEMVRSRKVTKVQRGDESVWLTFEDLMQFDDAALRAVFAAADPEVVLLALTGAEPRLIVRILRKLQPREAAALRHRLEHPGPLRLRDVEQARFAVAAVASRLAHEGAIELPASVRFAAAI